MESKLQQVIDYMDTTIRSLFNHMVRACKITNPVKCIDVGSIK